MNICIKVVQLTFEKSNQFLIELIKLKNFIIEKTINLNVTLYPFRDFLNFYQVFAKKYRYLMKALNLYINFLINNRINEHN